VVVEAAQEERLAGLVAVATVALFHQVGKTVLQILVVEQEVVEQPQAVRVMVGLVL
jgi:hypothetical protein